jgi:hypothetical protein
MCCARGIFCEKKTIRKKSVLQSSLSSFINNSFRLIKRSGGIGNNNFEVRALRGPKLDAWDIPIAIIYLK